MKTFLHKFGFFAIVFVMANLLFSSTAFGQETILEPTIPEPVVTLDQADLDYAPGETVYITGTGWKPGEVVTLEVDNLTNPEIDCGVYNPGPHELWTVTADGFGNFTASWFVNDCELGANLFLEAYGRESGFTFEIFFTDGAEPKINSITPLAGASGTIVTIVLNQPATSVTSVYFGATTAISFSLGVDQKTITVTAPGGSGLVNVIVNGTWIDKGDTLSFTDTYRNQFTLGCTAPTIIATNITGINNTAGLCSASVDFGIEINVTLGGSPTPTITYTTVDGTITSPHTFPVGTTTVTATTSNNGCGIASTTFDVVVKDNEAPLLVGVPANTTASCSAIPTKVDPTATDNCDPNPVVHYLGEVSTQDPDATKLAHYSYTLTRTWNATDVTGNISLTGTQVITVSDTTAPNVECKSLTVNLDVEGKVSILPEQVFESGNDNCSSVILVSVVPSSFSCSNVGNNTVVLTVRDITGNTSTCEATVTIEGYAVIDTQPEDKEIVYGCDAPILSVTASLVGTGIITYQWYKNTTSSNSGGTPITGETASSYQTPHNYSVGNYYYYVVVTANSCSVASNVATVTITPQVAAAVGDIYYTGPNMAWTTSATSNTATVTLSATIKNGLPCGDIRTARITFTVNGQPIPSATNLPVGFIDPNNPAMGGTASAIVQLNISGNATSDLFDIGVIISGNYTSGIFVQGVVTIIKPKPGGVIGGAADLCNENSTGYVKGTGLSKLNFCVEYAMKGKSITNPRGKVSLIVTSYNKSDGTTDTLPHYYLIKSNAIASLNITSPTATFSGKANIAEINPLTGVLTAIEGNCQMVLDLKDSTPDQVGITIQRNGGGIWYSNNWQSTKTVIAPVCGGVINVSGTQTSTAKIAEPVATKQAIVVQEEVLEPVPFNVIAYPNPAKYQFTLEVQGGSKEKVNVMVYDVLGRTIKHIESTDGQSVIFGEDLPAGAYFTIVSQGANQKTVRLIKE